MTDALAEIRAIIIDVPLFFSAVRMLTACFDGDYRWREWFRLVGRLLLLHDRALLRAFA